MTTTLQTGWAAINEFADDENDIVVRVTKSAEGIYSFHIGRVTAKGQLSRHFGIFVNKKTKSIRNRRADAIAKLVLMAEDYIDSEIKRSV